ncbi:MAG TPA: sensor histidine kinase [Actinomycetota bacterium]|nr:sensor histidine kinase [Actinomycetota bacterium]
MSRVLLYGGISASAVVALLVGIRRHRPDNRTPWYLLAVGQFVYTVAALSFYTLQDLLHSTVYPSAADVLYLGHYPFVVIGVLLLARSRTSGSDRGSLVDAAIIAIGVGMLSLVFLIEPAVAASEQPWLIRLVPAAYPIMDVLVLAVAARLVVGAGLRRPAFYLFIASLAMMLTTDTIYIFMQVKGLYEASSLAGSLLDLGWLSSYLLLGAAALHPSMRTLAQRDHRARSRIGRGRLSFLACAALLAPAAMIVQDVRGQQRGTAVMAVAYAVLFLLVIYRMAGLIRELETSASKARERGEALGSALGDLENAEAERKHLLDRTVWKAEEERTRIAAELHDGPIQRLTALAYQLEEAALTLEVDGRHTQELLTVAQGSLYAEINELRGLMATLRPPVLDERGLGLALADQVDSFQRRTGVPCSLESDRSTRLEPEIETVLYRVAQEALANVAKHSKAHHVWVFLRADDERAEMQIRDDGIGFDAARAGAMVGSGHFGLAGMRERVEMAGGSYGLVSAPGMGTLIRVRLPRRRVLA